jgi:hypothetical protein
VLGGAAFTGSGKLNLSGSSGYVDFPNGLISGFGNVTLEAWLSWNGGAQWQRIFDFGSSTTGENTSGTGLTYLMLTPQSSAGALQFAATTNSSAGQQTVSAPGALAIGQQMHVAVSYSFTAGTATLYVNGQNVASGLAPIPLTGINDVNVWLGRSQWNDPYFNGQFDEFRIYNGALNDQQVMASYATGADALFGPVPKLDVQVSGGSLKLLWPLNAPGFQLEQNGSIAGSGWATVANPPVLQNGQHVVTVPMSNTMQFFRLRKFQSFP